MGTIEALAAPRAGVAEVPIKRVELPFGVDQIEDGDFLSAGRILNLVHNLPLDEASEQRWDIDYFLSMELPTFLEHFEEIKSARLIALYVCKLLAYQYDPDQ